MNGGIFFAILTTYLLGVIGASMLFSLLDDSDEGNGLLYGVFAFLWPMAIPLLGVLAIMYAIKGQFGGAR